MAQVSLIASTVLMGVLVVAVVALVTRSRSRHPSMLARSTAGGRFISTNETPALERLVDSTASWVASFLLITFGVLAVVLLAVNGVAFSALPMYAAGGAILVGIVLGSYVMSRNAGLKNAWATMVTATVLGIILLAALTAVLLIS